MGDEETTTKTTIELTPEEKALQDFVMNKGLPLYMKNIGYDLSFEEKTTPNNPEKIASLQSQITGLQEQLGKTTDPKVAANLNKQLDSLNKQLGDEQGNVKTTIEPKMEQNEMGVKMDAFNEKVFGYKEQMTDATVANALKFMKGDYSLSDSQTELLNKTFGAITDAVTPMLDALKGEYEATGKSMLDELSNVTKEIEATGLSVEAGFNAIGEQLDYWKEGVTTGIEGEQKALFDTGDKVKAALQGVKDVINKGGEDAKSMLKQTFAMKRSLYEMDMKDTYNTMAKASATKAAALGRSPMDPQFQMEMLNGLTDQISKTSLTMAMEESLMKVGLVKDTSGKLESLAYQQAALEGQLGSENQALAAKKTELASQYGQAKTGIEEKKTGFAESQGAKKEAVAGQKVGVAEMVGHGKESVAASKASLAESIAKGKAQTSLEIGMGIPAKSVGIGMDVAGLTSALGQQDLSNKAGAATIGQPLMSTLSQEAMVQPTVTQTTSGSVFGDVLGGIGILGGAAGSVMGGIGSLKK